MRHRIWLGQLWTRLLPHLAILISKVSCFGLIFISSAKRHRLWSSFQENDPHIYHMILFMIVFMMALKSFQENDPHIHHMILFMIVFMMALKSFQENDPHIHHMILFMIVFMMALKSFQENDPHIHHMILFMIVFMMALILLGEF